MFRAEKRGEWEEVVAALDGARLESRWVVFPKLRWGQTFDRSAEPFQSFRCLVPLRNAIAHYSPRAVKLDAFPSYAVKGLASKFEFTTPENTACQNRVLNSACAGWACRTTKAMIQRYCALGGRPDPWIERVATIWGSGEPQRMPSDWADPPEA